MTRARTRFLLGATVFIGLALGVQAQDRLPRFEVATVKENTSGESRMQTVTRPGGRFVAGNAPLNVVVIDRIERPTPDSLAVGRGQRTMKM